MNQSSEVLTNRVLNAVKQVENHVDSQIEKLDNFDLDDMRSIREKRLAELKKQFQQKQTWRGLGHGEYTEIAEEKEFFSILKKSHNIVCLFFTPESPRCKIIDHHLKILSSKHLEAKFVKINATRAPFLTDRLGIRIIPTVALIKDNKATDYIVGFTELGNCDDFSTEMLEWRMAHSSVIDYSGDLSTPPDNPTIKRRYLSYTKKAIRETQNEDDDDDEFLND